MFNRIFGRLACLGGKHERSLKHVKQSADDRHTSVCAYCGVPMVRRSKRNWTVVS